MSQSLGRALQILIELGKRPSTLDELAELTAVHKTTVLQAAAHAGGGPLRLP